MNLGAPEILIVTLLVLPIIVAVVVVIDAARRPQQAWEAAGQNQTLWIVLPLVLLLGFGVGSLIASIVYLVAVRPKLVAAVR